MTSDQTRRVHRESETLLKDGASCYDKVVNILKIRTKSSSIIFVGRETSMKSIGQFIRIIVWRDSKRSCSTSGRPPNDHETNAPHRSADKTVLRQPRASSQHVCSHPLFLFLVGRGKGADALIGWLIHWVLDCLIDSTGCFGTDCFAMSAFYFCFRSHAAVIINIFT
jgi:hypothetical protein